MYTESNDFTETVRQYQEELKRLAHRRMPDPLPPAPVPTEPAVPLAVPPLAITPVPVASPISNNTDATVEEAGEMSAPPEKAASSQEVYQTQSDYPVREQEPWESDEATLAVYAYTARQGLPVPYADVTISRSFEDRQVLHFFTRTDVSGETVPKTLPAPPREWTLEPEQTHPFASYMVQVDAPGFYTVQNIHVPVFGGEASLQPVEMIPLPENESLIREKVVLESEPPEL